MSMRRPQAEEITAMLQEGHFRSSDHGEVSTDPIQDTPMLVEVERILPYRHNPRRSENPQYEAIKASIQATGMEQVLVITRCPGDELYQLARGGNTRLKAVQALWQETGDPRFRAINCLYTPWRGDTDALIGHLKENDLRGDLTFIDRALAIRELKDLVHQDEPDGKELSQRALLDAIEQRGYRVSRAMLIWYEYAVDALWPYIPLALQAGMGRPAIETLRGLLRAFDAVWVHTLPHDPEGWKLVYPDVLARFDQPNPAIDAAALRRELETEASVASEVDVAQISLLFGAAMDGRPLGESSIVSVTTGEAEETTQQPSVASTPKPIKREDEPPLDAPSGPAPANAPPTPDLSGFQTPEAAGDDDGRRPSPATSSQTAAPSRAGPAVESGPSTAPVASFEDLFSDQAGDVEPGELPQDLMQLRLAAAARASAINQRTGLAAPLVTLSTGVGYVIGDFSADSRIDYEHGAQVWWLLASLSDQFVGARQAVAMLPADWRGTQVARGMAADPFDAWLRGGPEAIPHPMTGRLAAAGLARLDDDSWRDWRDLAEIHRTIHRLTGGQPWCDAALQGGQTHGA